MSTAFIHRLYIGLPAAQFPADTRLLRETADAFLEGYTLYMAKGVWKGIPEHSIILEYIGNDITNLMKCLAEEVKVLFEQEAILFTVQPIEMELI